MKVAVTGATGVIGTSAVSELVAAGHDVVGLARTQEKSDLLASLGATGRLGRLGDHDFLVELFSGADAVVNLATHVPVGLSGALPRAWRTNDLLRTEGVRRVVEAARDAGVRRIVQESVSFLYADQGDDWISEDSPLDITRATEPASVAEAQVQDYQCGSRTGVVLRFGTAMAVIDEYLILGGFNRDSPTYTWTIFMYDQAFKTGLWRQGFAAAIGMIGAAVMMAFVAALLYVFRPKG